ncbi:hypothetical protein MMC25_004627 [Agyrium rufum]|nr:hypothetical protein [Agyrium rufum]
MNRGLATPGEQRVSKKRKASVDLSPASINSEGGESSATPSMASDTNGKDARTPDLLDFLSSKQFTFKIGPDGTEFHIPVDLITALSPALKQLACGSMKEAETGIVTFEEIDVETFLRICQFATRSNYDGEFPDYYPNNDGGYSTYWVDYSYNSITRPKNDGSFESRRYAHPYQKAQMSTQSKEVATTAIPAHDCTREVIGHARVYTFADQWGIRDLVMTAIGKLWRFLRVLSMKQDLIPSILELISYVYDNTNEPLKDQPPEPLRDLLASFVAWYTHGDRSRSYRNLDWDDAFQLHLSFSRDWFRYTRPKA